MVGFLVLQKVLPKYERHHDKRCETKRKFYKWSKLISEKDAACNLSWCMHEDSPWSVLMMIILFIHAMWADVHIQKGKLCEYSLNAFRFQWTSLWQLWSLETLTVLVGLSNSNICYVFIGHFYAEFCPCLWNSRFVPSLLK